MKFATVFGACVSSSATVIFPIDVSMVAWVSAVAAPADRRTAENARVRSMKGILAKRCPSLSRRQEWPEGHLCDGFVVRPSAYCAGLYRAASVKHRCGPLLENRL